jgi:primosomal protein N'
LPQALSLLDYLVPPELEQVIAPGILVEIPLGTKKTHGLVISIAEDLSTVPQKIKSILAMYHNLPALSREQVGFLSEVSALYHAPLGALLTANLFSFQKKSLTQFATATRELLFPPDSTKIFAQKTAYYSYLANRGNMLSEITHTSPQAQHLVLAPTIEEADKLFTELKECLPNTRLCTSATGAGSLRTLWFELWSGTPLVVVGTRRALYLPWHHLATVMVDAESDNSYQSFESAPRGHVRDLAYLLAKHHAATLVLSGHTPSLVGYEQARALPQAIPVFPHVALPEHVDVAKERQVGLAGLVSLELERRLHAAPNGISFLYLNQRGTAQCIMCKDCRHTYRCPTCSSTLTYHTRGNRLSCHSCGHEQKLGSCPECGGFTVKRFGYGTGSLEEYIHHEFPHRPCIRLDSDQSELDIPLTLPGSIIIGTDFAWSRIPWQALTLFSCIDLESALHIPEWYISEQTWYRLRDAQFRLPTTAEFVIQSSKEYEKSLVPHLGDPTAWYEKELSQRRFLGYPPFSTIIRFHLEYPNKSAAEQEVARVFQRLRELTKNDDRYTIHHPAPLRPFERHGRYRYGIIAKIREPNLSAAASLLLAEVPPAWKIAINPAHLLS